MNQLSNNRNKFIAIIALLFSIQIYGVAAKDDKKQLSKIVSRGHAAGVSYQKGTLSLYDKDPGQIKIALGATMGGAGLMLMVHEKFRGGAALSGFLLTCLGTILICKEQGKLRECPILSLDQHYLVFHRTADSIPWHKIKRIYLDEKESSEATVVGGFFHTTITKVRKLILVILYEDQAYPCQKEIDATQFAITPQELKGLMEEYWHNALQNDQRKQ